jgi:hypothetical protein
LGSAGPYLDFAALSFQVPTHGSAVWAATGNVGIVPRRAGLDFQVAGESVCYGHDDDTEVPDREEVERAVITIASLVCQDMTFRIE